MVTLHHRQPAPNPRNVSVSVQLQHLHQPQSHGLALRYAGSRHSLAVVAAAAAAGGAGSPDGRLPIKQQLLGFIQAHYLPLALLTALLLGATFPGLGVAAAGLQIPTFTTFGIFVVQGLQLRRKEAAAALSARGAIAYGLASILLLTPLLGLAAVQLPLQPPALAVGLGVFCCMPTALSSGVTFTQQLGGNVSLALLLTVTSNILGIFTMPFLLPHILAAAPIAAGSGAAAAGPVLEPLPLLVQLVQTILLPTLLGAAIRGFVPGAAAFIDARRKLMSYISAALLALVPWMQISKTASQQVALDVLGILGAAAAGVAIHAAFLAANFTACRLLRLGGEGAAGRDVRRAVLLVSSVKTLPVAVTVCSKLAPVLGDAMVGTAVVPCVLAHLAQIIFDSIMVSRWMAADKLAAGEDASGAGR